MEKRAISSSVVICTRNRLQDLTHTLHSLSKQKKLPSEIVIVDSSDARLDAVQEFKNIFTTQFFPGVSLVYKHTTPGLTKQRNEGIDLAQSDVLYFFDDDVELEPEYLEEMDKIFLKNPSYGGGMGNTTNLAPQPSRKYRFFRKLFLLQRNYSSGNFTWSGMPTHAYGTDRFKDVEVLGGCCFAFRKKVLQKHLFDETLGRYAYMEDCDVSKRISDHSPFFYNPNARLKHFHSPVARDKVVDNRAMYVKNYSYLFFKNFYPQSKIRLLGYAWSILGLFAEAVLFRKKDEIKGYWKGLKMFYRERNKRA